MQYFYINQNSTLPALQMELIYDGRNDFNKFYEAIQNSEITFSMIDINTNLPKISNASAYIKLKENSNCVKEYLICYNWKKRDTKEKGIYRGIFNIHFKDDIKNENETIQYPIGDLIMPIREELIITIK